MGAATAAGFRGLKFGSKCEEVEGFKGNKEALKAAGKLRTDKEPFMGLLQYRNPDDTLEIGETPLLDVSYTCYRDQLMRVEMLAWGDRAVEELRFTFTTAFGPAPTADPDAGSWMWQGSKMLLTLHHEAATDAVRATFTSLEAVEQKRKDDDAARRSAVQDL